MTSQWELEVIEAAIFILREAEAVVRKEIKESGQCLNIDFNRISLIQGAITYQKKWAGYYRVRIVMKQRHDQRDAMISANFSKYATKQARQTNLADEFCMQIDTSSGRWMVCIDKPKHFGDHRYVPMSPTKDENLRMRAAEIRRDAN